ncbi:MAG: division plane positioning ATPase MipZ [Sphingomonadaceae bacterium]|nr:AAA family ATPase [Sphingomonadaceae bacterium]
MWNPSLSEAGRTPPSVDQTAAFNGDGEHPSVVLRDVASRPRPDAHIITFANEKGGVGKSTLAFHTAIALADAGQKVAIIDLDRRQRSLDNALTNREGTARNLKVRLPTPAHCVLEKPNGAQLSQEMARIGQGCNFILIDAPGHDSPVFRRAIAMADTLVTPVNSSFVDLEMLGRHDPVTMRLRAPGQFGAMVEQLRAERERMGRGTIDWIVARNRVRNCEARNSTRIDRALAGLAERFDFRLADGLSERVAYRELFLFGLTHLDIHRIPRLAHKQYRVGNEVQRLMEAMRLNFERCDWVPPREAKVPVSAKVTRAYDEIIQSYA